MNSLLKFATNILWIAIGLASCSKDNTVAKTSNNYLPPPLPYTVQSVPTDSLPGQEYIFYDLIWNYDWDGAANLYIGIENKPDLFSQDRVVAVFLKPENNNNWIAAERFHYPNNPGYVYSVYSNCLFIFHSPHIFPWSADTQLAGTRVDLKVKII